MKGRLCKSLLLLFLPAVSFGYPSFPLKESYTISKQNNRLPLSAESALFHADAPADSISQALRKIYEKARRLNISKKPVEAIELFNQFIDMAVNRGYEKYFWRELRMSLSQLSSINSELKNYDKSIQSLTRALDITARYNPTDYDVIYFFLFNIALSYYNQNDYNNSLEYYNQAAALLPKISNPPVNKKENLFNNLALNYFKLGRDLEAQNYLNESIEIKKSHGDNYELATSYNNIALVLQKKSRFSEALSYFDKSIFLHDSLGNQEKIAFVINNIGNLYLDKENFDSAKLFYQRSFLLRRTIKAKPSELLVSYNNLSYIYYKLHILDSAIIFNNLALEVNKPVLDAQPDSQTFLLSDYLMSITDRIEINTKLFRRSQNRDYLAHSFLLFYPTIKIIIDHLFIYNTILSANVFLNEQKRFFDSSIVSAHILDSINNIACPRTLLISETFKSLSMLNIAREIRHLQPDLDSNRQYSKVNSYYQWQEELLSNNESRPQITMVSQIDSIDKGSEEFDDKKDQVTGLIKVNLEKYFMNLADSIQSHINKQHNRLTIDYYCTNNSIFLHAISKSKISCSVSSISQELISAIQSYPLSIKTIDHNSAKRSGKILKTHLLDSILEELNNFDNVTIIPDQTLAQIPFEALVLEDIAPINKYLIDKYIISYRFSILNRNFSQISPNKSYSTDFFGIAPFESSDTTYHNLQGSAREIEGIASLFHSHNWTATCLTGKEATYHNFSLGYLDAKFLHLSTHSFISSRSSQLSFLEFFQSEERNNLFLPTLSMMPFRNELLILNACQTGNNILAPNTGFVSFIHYLSSVSTRNYICTLWNILDEPSFEFMMVFYTYLLNGERIDKALTETKRTFIKSDKYSYPIFWSPFILYENN